MAGKQTVEKVKCYRNPHGVTISESKFAEMKEGKVKSCYRPILVEKGKEPKESAKSPFAVNSEEKKAPVDDASSEADTTDSKNAGDKPAKK